MIRALEKPVGIMPGAFLMGTYPWGSDPGAHVSFSFCVCVYVLISFYFEIV